MAVILLMAVPPPVEILPVVGRLLSLMHVEVALFLVMAGANVAAPSAGPELEWMSIILLTQLPVLLVRFTLEKSSYRVFLGVVLVGMANAAAMHRGLLVPALVAADVAVSLLAHRVYVELALSLVPWSPMAVAVIRD